ncbi:DMT family transporter [Candidatus Saccharibacteria bacterium]|nr:DMT family transporter [Candidatus Saccharibacteria bacterium]
MSNLLAIAILGGLGGMLGWGFADFFAKKTVDRIGDIKSLVWAHLFGVSFFALAVAFQYAITGHFISIPRQFNLWLGLAFFGSLQMLVYWLVYQGFSKGQLIVLNPIFASYSGIVALVSIIFLHEKPNSLVLAALLLIFSGILLMNLDLKGLSSRRINLVPGLKEMIAASSLAAIWTLLWDKFVGGRNALSFALFMYAFMTLAALILAKSRRVALVGIPQNLLKFLALIGLGEAVAYLSISYGFSRTPYTSVVALISGAFSLPAIVLGYRFLNERVSRTQVVAIAIVVAGIILVSVG